MLERLYPEPAVRVAFLVLGFVLLVLVTCHAGAIVLDTMAPSDNTVILREFFSLNKEGNAPTWFSSLLFLLIGLSCGAIYFAERYAPLGSELLRKTSPFWLLFSFMFIFLSFDETSQLHERLDWIMSGLSEGGRPSEASGDLASQQLPFYRYLLIYIPVLGALGMAMAWFVIRRFQHPVSALLFFIGMSCLAMKLMIESVEKWSLSMTWFGHKVYLEAVIVEMTCLFIGAILIFTSLLNYLFRLLRSAFVLRTHQEMDQEVSESPRSQAFGSRSTV
ncbi:MAG: hypothetical protein ACR2QJ_08045 [Geminicoccaceae bacterium]